MFIVVSLIFLTVRSIAQENQPLGLAKPFKLDSTLQNSVQFKIGLNNRVMDMISTNILRCELSNHSSNVVLYMSTYANNATSVYITNNGCFYALINQSKLQTNEDRVLGSGGPAITFLPLNPGETKKWQLSFIISNDVNLGEYKLVAGQLVVKSGSEYCCWYFQTNIDVKIK
jgi:uncharacterized membrane protein